MKYSKIISILPITFLVVLMSVLGNEKATSQIIIMWTTYAISVFAIFFGETWKAKQEDTKMANNMIYMAYIGLLFINMLFCLPIAALHQLLPFRIVMLMLLAALAGLLINVSPTSGRLTINLLATDNQDNKLYKKWPSVFRPLRNDKSIYLFALIGIVLVGFLLRIRNLLCVDSFFEEDVHIFHIINLLETGSFEMERSRFVTYLSAFFAWLADAKHYHEFLYWGRVPSVVFASITSIPIYLLGRSISKETAVIAALLWVTSPWALGVARYLREPAYFPLFILLTSLFLLRIIILTLNLNKDNFKKIVAYSLPIIMLLYYAFFVDAKSHLKISAVIYAAITVAFVIAYAQDLLKYFKANKYLPYFFILFIGAFGALMSRSRFLNYNKVDVRWADTFLNPNIVSPMHWWHHYENDIYLVYLLLTLGVAFAYRYKQKHFLVYMFTTLIVVAGYHFFFDRYYQPRYIFYVLPFFVLTIAGSLYFIFKSLNDITSSNLRTTLKTVMLLFILLIFNFKNTLISSTAPHFGVQYSTISTGAKHNDKAVAIDFFGKMNEEEQENLKKSGFVTSTYKTAIKHEFGVPLENFSQYKAKDIDRFDKVEAFVDKYEEGYIVLDHHRNGVWERGFPLDTLPFRIGNCEAQLIQNKKLCHIYKWKHTNYSATTKDFIHHELLQNAAEKPLFQIVETAHFLNEKESLADSTTIQADSLAIQTNEKISIQDTILLDLSKPLSIAFWAKLKGGQQQQHSLFELGDFQKNGMNILANHPKAMDKLAFIYASEGDCRAAKTPKLSSQSWHQIIWYHEGNCEGANYGVYFDGKKIGECVIPNTKNLKIPLQINTKKSPIHIKALSIFDEALTAEQAKKMYQHTSFEPQTLPNATDYLAVSNNMLSSYKYQKDLLVEENEPQINKVEQPTEKTFVDMSKAISVSFWLKTDSTKVKSPFRIGEKDDQIGLLVDFVEKEEELTFRYKPLSQHSNMVQSNEINDGKWHHVIWFQYGGAVNAPYGLFVDGDLGEYAKIPVKQSSNLPIILNKEFNGKIADMKVYPYVVKRMEVYKLFSKGGDTTKVNQISKVK